MSIRLRLTLWHTSLFGLVLAGFAVVVYVAVARQMTSQLDYAIHVQALEAARALHTIAVGPPTVHVRRLDLPATAALAESPLYVQVVDPSGRVLASSGSLAEPLRATLVPTLDGRDVHTTLSVLGDRVELYSSPLQVDGVVVGVLQVVASLQPIETSLTWLGIALAAVVVGTTLLVALLGWFLARTAMQPVDRLTRTARAIGRSADPSRRLPRPRQRDEIGRLAETFNEMLGQLEQALSTQRRFLADASHELRTPLAAIRTNLAALLRNEDADSVLRLTTLRAAMQDADRMGRLVVDLLTLARADAGQPIDRRPLALDTLLLEVYQQEKTLAGDVQLQIGDLEQVEVTGDPDRLKQLLINLMDNALRWTPPGGTVTVGLTRRHAWAMLEVHDTGIGIDAEHLPRIFDRFYRVDYARSRDPGGTGLGLAISRWIAEAHGGSLAVVSQVGVGSTFTILLPVGVEAASPASPIASSLSPVRALTSL
jgi:two-component system, OmpR family, sensor kinase